MIKIQLTFFNIVKPINYKEDETLGIVLFCPTCGKVKYLENKCEECGQLLDREYQIYNKNKKVKW